MGYICQNSSIDTDGQKKYKGNYKDRSFLKVHFHLITLVAALSISKGTFNPKAVASLRFTIICIFFGPPTGIVDGFSPFTILATISAASLPCSTGSADSVSTTPLSSPPPISVAVGIFCFLATLI